MFQSQLCRQQRTADGEKGALHQGCGDRKSNASLRLAIQAIPGKRFVISAVMHQFKQTPRHRKRAMHLNITGQSCLPETAIQLAELRHRKTMAAGKRSAVNLVINERWFQRFTGSSGSEASEAWSNTTGQVAQLAQSLQLHLSHTLTRDLKKPTDFSQCVTLLPVQPETQGKHVLFLVTEMAHPAPQLLVMDALLHLVEGLSKR